VNWQNMFLLFRIILYYVILAKCKAMVVIEAPQYRRQQSIINRHQHIHEIQVSTESHHREIILNCSH